MCVHACECEGVMQPLGALVLVESEPPSSLPELLLSLARFRRVLSLVFSSTALKSQPPGHSISCTSPAQEAGEEWGVGPSV